MGNKLSKMAYRDKSESGTATAATPVSKPKQKTEAIGSTITPEIPKKHDPQDLLKNDQTSTPIPKRKPEVGPLAAQLASTLAFDPEKIKEKYLAERDKRLRKDGNDQYKQFKGQFEHYLTDPYTPQIERAPFDVKTDFLVLGGGFGGLSIAAELIKAGIKNIKIIDKAGDFGGTWYWNRYPGAACDIGQ
jgi:putative NAD(P)-binding protein